MKPKTTAEARSTFFQETDDTISVFCKPGWTGCVVDGDRHGVHRMPRLLWDLIVACCNKDAWHIYGYLPIGVPDEGPAVVQPVWEQFTRRDVPALVFPEWLALDDSCQWAVLAEYDVTVFGCAPEIAARASEYLKRHGTSFRELSENDYPGAENWPFFKSLFINAL